MLESKVSPDLLDELIRCLDDGLDNDLPIEQLTEIARSVLTRFAGVAPDYPLIYGGSRVQNAREQ